MSILILFLLTNPAGAEDLCKGWMTRPEIVKIRQKYESFVKATKRVKRTNHCKDRIKRTVTRDKFQVTASQVISVDGVKKDSTQILEVSHKLSYQGMGDSQGNKERSTIVFEKNSQPLFYYVRSSDNGPFGSLVFEERCYFNDVQAFFCVRNERSPSNPQRTEICLNGNDVAGKKISNIIKNFSTNIDDFLNVDLNCGSDISKEM